jgi:hypothetical protein
MLRSCLRLTHFLRLSELQPHRLSALHALLNSFSQRNKTMDRPVFYAELRKRGSGVFGTSISQAQVDGLEAILDEGQRRGSKTNHLAYILATAYHETAGRMQPVREALATTDNGAIRSLESAWKAGKLKWVKRPYWRKDVDGNAFFGRGYVQITHKDNYAKFGIADNPSKALETETALRILFDGMEQGAFTSRKLSDLIDDEDETDEEDLREFVNARSIVNGNDRALLIGQHALAFEDALRGFQVPTCCHSAAPKHST